MFDLESPLPWSKCYERKVDNIDLNDKIGLM